MSYSVNRELLDGVLLSYDFEELENGNFNIKNAMIKIGDDLITLEDGLSYKKNKGRLEFILFDILPIYSIQTIDGQVISTVNKDLTDVDFRNITKIHKSIDKELSLENIRIINSQRREKWPFLSKNYKYNDKDSSSLRRADLHTHFNEILTHEEFEEVINIVLDKLGIKNFTVDKMNYSIPIQNGQVNFADFENILEYRGSVAQAIIDKVFVLPMYRQKIQNLSQLLDGGKRNKVKKTYILFDELIQLYENLINQIHVLYQKRIITETEYDILKQLTRKWKNANLTPNHLKKRFSNREISFEKLSEILKTIMKSIDDSDRDLVSDINLRIRSIIYYETLKKSINLSYKSKVDYVEMSISDGNIISFLTKKMKKREREKFSFLYSVSRKKMGSDSNKPVFNEKEFEELLRERKIVGFDLMGEEKGLTKNDITNYKDPNSFCSVIYRAIDKMISCKKSDSSRDFVLRIHSGENEESNYNPLYSLAVIEKILKEKFGNDRKYWPKIRIGHGLYLPKEEELQKEYARLLIDLDVVVEINASSNYSLSNFKNLSTIPYEWYQKCGINVVFGTDGPGMYYTSLRQQRILARESSEEIVIPLEIELPESYKEMMKDVSSSLAEFSKTNEVSEKKENEEDLKNELVLLYSKYKIIQKIFAALEEEKLIRVKSIDIDNNFANLLSGKKINKDELEQFISKVETLLSKEQEIISGAQKIPLYYYKKYISIISQGDDVIESAQDEKFDLIDGKKMDRRGRIEYSLGELHRYFRDELSNGFEFENIDLFSDTLKDVKSCLEKGDLDTAELKITALEIKSNLVLSFLPAFKKIVVENESLDYILSRKYSYELSKIKKAVIITSLNYFDNDKLVLSEKDNIALLSNYKYYDKYLDMFLNDDIKNDNKYKKLTNNENDTMIDRDNQIKKSLKNLQEELPSIFKPMLDSIDSYRKNDNYDIAEMKIVALEIVNDLDVSILPAFKKIVTEKISISDILSRKYTYESPRMLKGGKR